MHKAAIDYHSETQSRFRLYSYDPEIPILETSDLLLPTDQFFKKINQSEQIKKSKISSPTQFDVAIDRDELPP